MLLASQTDRHWHKGYISGAFDMFHIGHLNLIRRAKERCDYLVVGVLSDEMVGRKGKWPVVPLEARMAIVGAIKYVDEIDVTTRALMNKVTAWEKYHFDAMFSGDDHLYDGWGDSEEAALRERGADLVFFPYTKEVSTTQLHDAVLPPKIEGADKARKLDGFEYLFPFHKVKKGERVVIYGTGNVGGQYARQLAAVPYCEIVAFANTFAEPGSTFEGKPCLSFDELMQAQGIVEYDRIVIASTTYYGSILGRMRIAGVRPELIV